MNESGGPGVVRLGPRHYGLFHNYLNQLVGGQSRLRDDFRLLVRLLITLNLSQLCRLFRGVELEGFEGRDINDGRFGVSEGGIVLRDVIHGVPLVREGSAAAAVGPFPFSTGSRSRAEGDIA